MCNNILCNMSYRKGAYRYEIPSSNSTRSFSLKRSSRTTSGMTNFVFAARVSAARIARGPITRTLVRPSRLSNTKEGVSSLKHT